MEVWKKGHGVAGGVQLVKINGAEGHAHIEAWVKWALLPGVYVGEMGTEGAMGALPKRKLRHRVEEIERLLR